MGAFEAMNVDSTAQTLASFGTGLALSFIGSMPIAGPVAVLVLERGLLKRSSEGLRIAIGAAVPESIYAFFAFWGIGTALRAYPVVLPLSRIVTGAVLI